MTDYRFYKNVFLSTGNCTAQLELFRRFHCKTLYNTTDPLSDTSKKIFSKKCIAFGIL